MFDRENTFFKRDFGGNQFDPRTNFRGRERFAKGHLNMIVLEIIKEQPRHGYDVIKEMEEKFHGFYSPSAGSIYPILQILEDQGFVTSSTEGGKKIYTITKEGEAELKENKDKFAHMHEHLQERFGDMERLGSVMEEMKQTARFMFGKLRHKGFDNPETVKKLRVAMANFRSEVEEILLDKKKNMKNKTNLWIIVGLTVLNAIGLTIVFPLFPFLIAKYVPDAHVAFILSALVSVYALCQFLAAPVFGALSDRYGRKSIFIVSLLGSAVGYVLLGIGGALWVLFLGRIIDGLTAGDQSALFAYIADSTKPEERGKWYGYLGGAMGVGIMIGPGIGGLLGATSITLPFFVTAGITLLSALLTTLFLPESLPPEKRITHISLKSLNTFSHFKEIFSLKEARALLIMGGFFYVGLNIWQFNASIFLKDVFLWGPSLIGGIFVLVGVCDILSRVILLPQLLKKWSDRTIGIVGLFGLAIGTALIFVSAHFPSPALIIAAVACIVLGEGLFDPSYNARLSLSVDESKQGQLQGANQSLQALYHVLVPLGAAAVYTYSHGGVFGIASVLLCAALVMFVRLKTKEGYALA